MENLGTFIDVYQDEETGEVHLLAVEVSYEVARTGNEIRHTWNYSMTFPLNPENADPDNI